MAGGFERRKHRYKLCHILNHLIYLGYLHQAERITAKLLAVIGA